MDYVLIWSKQKLDRPRCRQELHLHLKHQCQVLVSLKDIFANRVLNQLVHVEQTGFLSTRTIHCFLLVTQCPFGCRCQCFDLMLGQNWWHIQSRGHIQVLKGCGPHITEGISRANHTSVQICQALEKVLVSQIRKQSWQRLRSRFTSDHQELNHVCCSQTKQREDMPCLNLQVLDVSEVVGIKVGCPSCQQGWQILRCGESSGHAAQKATVGREMSNSINQLKLNEALLRQNDLLF